ncbi:hypothetical protein [Streptomyces sp. NPDC051016]|uniref:hypothetical protein n=1 Tax=Streptomyces sp. NPDC051016 TaxID=3365638 RepID=UPI0037A4E861
MSPTPARSGSVRPAAVVNAAIRAIVVRAQGREWTWAETALYRVLVEEWETARRAEVVEAA